MNQNNFQKLAEKIKLLISDVDGVLTDGKILISSNGEESKFFNSSKKHPIKSFLKQQINISGLSFCREK